MATYKCKMCGGDLLIEAGMSVCECEYCGTKQTVPNADNEKKMTLFARAGRLLRGCEFDKAAGVFETIVGDYPQEAEAYWGLVLCHYGIEYVDDPATGKKVPTCHRSSFDGVMKNENFEQACENADAIARRIYRDEARAIEELRKGIIEVSGKEEPYDIFISYKETDANGNRTLDSVLAQDMYDALTEKGYRVFFSRITLEDKLGTEYEPYIFAALNSAKVMLVVGTDYEHFDAVWVKNEWSRFLKLIAGGQKKTLIPCFKNMDAYDMPEEFAKLTAQDMGKIGAMQDLLRGIGKLLGEKHSVNHSDSNTTDTVDGMLNRAFMLLENSNWEIANEYADKVLETDSQNGQAYLVKLMLTQKLQTKKGLEKLSAPLRTYQYADELFSNADHKLRAELDAANAVICDRIYDKAEDFRTTGEVEKEFRYAANLFESILEWKDSEEKRNLCLQAAEEVKAKVEEKRKRTKNLVGKVGLFATLAIVIVVGVYFAVNYFVIPMRNYNEAVKYMEAESYVRAISLFEKLDDYKDSAQLKVACEEAKKEQDYQKAIALLEEGEYYKASREFSVLGKYKDSADYKLIAEEKYYFQKLKEVEIGKIASFGSYFQNVKGERSNISWIVVDKKDNMLCLVSSRAIAVRAYNGSSASVSWAKSDLRAWLNDKFYDLAFSEDEKQMIVAVNDTKDKVSLLSATEYGKCSQLIKGCLLTDYASNNAQYAYVKDTGKCSYWLRSQSDGKTAHVVVAETNTISNYPVNYSHVGVRPVIWIDISD